MRRWSLVLGGFFLTGIVLSFSFASSSRSSSSHSGKQADDLKGAFRRSERNGWTFVHLQGTPHEIGFQNGYLLAPEIADTLKVVQLEETHESKKDWQFYRDAAENMMWPHIEQEYRDEMQGIADGINAHGGKIDLWDVVALNGAEEWSYYVEEYNKEHGIKTSASLVVPEHCSAFVATGSYTKDGKIVIAHNDWTPYLDGARWTIIYDIVPASGKRMLMDGLPGVIHSADDFVMNSAGIVITETTIGHFYGYDTNGIPEFIRARKAAQYSTSIDDFTRIMKDGNNGGYANTWLIADTNKNEIGRLELGLKNVTLERKTDGYFVGSNFPISEKLIREETDGFDPHNMSESSNARHLRWEQLMAQNKGKIDVAAAERFMADHFDTFENKVDPDERTLDGHIDLSPRGDGDWQPPYGPAGAVQNKVADASLTAQMSFVAAAGHACGMDFKAADHLSAHPEFDWQKPLLRDMDAYPWTTFSAAK
ncbi:MAG TPA: C45 family peptidase [Candidatus Sulfotelmatobacter sp.]|nr:C45 family peptidase [Candidatus Sulfotelmatobacter sp.]